MSPRNLQLSQYHEKRWPFWTWGADEQLHILCLICPFLRQVALSRGVSVKYGEHVSCCVPRLSGDASVNTSKGTCDYCTVRQTCPCFALPCKAVQRYLTFRSLIGKSALFDSVFLCRRVLSENSFDAVHESTVDCFSSIETLPLPSLCRSQERFAGCIPGRLPVSILPVERRGETSGKTPAIE